MVFSKESEREVSLINEIVGIQKGLTSKLSTFESLVQMEF